VSSPPEPEPRSETETGDSSPVTVTSSFVRGRNALLVQADFSPLYVDYYLHWMDVGLRQREPYDGILKLTLAALVLHCTTRPWRETHAWTLNLPSPACNVFATAGSLQESVVGRVFTEDVRPLPNGLFHAQVSVPHEETRTSAVPLESPSVFPAVEAFYRLSEQRRARLFEVADEVYAMVSAQPGCDEPWLESLSADDVRSLAETEELGYLESRRFRFHCGCSLERVLPALAPLAAQGLDHLFQGEQAITVTCPRCGHRWRLTREQFEATGG
jgi:molecular chaperone Hsp33